MYLIFSDLQFMSSYVIREDKINNPYTLFSIIAIDGLMKICAFC